MSSDQGRMSMASSLRSSRVSLSVSGVSDSQSMIDLEMTEEDNIMMDLLDDDIEEEEIDRENRERRRSNREDMLLSLYAFHEYEVRSCVL